ncbi:MAG TPA: SIR2 family protein [Pyrinomonadaceae bacterium]
MIPDTNIDTLAEEMARRHKESGSADAPCDSDLQEPFILFIGAGSATAAGVPTIETIARQLLSGTSGLIEKTLSGALLDNKDQLLSSFYNLLDDLTGGQIYRMLQSFYVDVPVPVFYQDLALLIKDGYFSRILTTNVDTLLEQALNGAGMRLGLDYQVMNLGAKHTETPSLLTSQSESQPEPPLNPTHIIKLHGDIGQEKIGITPEQIENALRSNRRMAKRELKGDIVMVGYEFENRLINDWLTSSRKRDLWWVNSQPPLAPDVDISLWGENISQITGETGKPETFFSQLALRLLRLPVLESLKQSVEEGYSLQPEAQSTSIRGMASRISPDDEDIVIKDLRTQIRSSLALISSLEQSTSVNERPRSVQAQIDYQKQQIVELEDRMRMLSKCRQRLGELMEQITDAIRTAHLNSQTTPAVSQSTLDYVEKQRKLIFKEYERDKPGQPVISSAIGATVLLADRLNTESATEVVSSDLVRELASFAPYIIARGIR